MGCDIHVMVEARKFPGGSNEWFNVDNWRHNPFSRYEGEPCMTVKAIYDIRDYELFSFLADVRNYGHNPSFALTADFQRMPMSTPPLSMPGGAKMHTHPATPPFLS